MLKVQTLKRLDFRVYEFNMQRKSQKRKALRYSEISGFECKQNGIDCCILVPNNSVRM